MEIKRNTGLRIALATAGFSGLALIYLFQYTDFLLFASGQKLDPRYHFVTNRLTRIFVNDLSMMALIYAFFFDKKVLKLVLAVQLIDLVILFPAYVLIKLHVEGISEISSPFLSQFHRLIVNPILLILVIPALFYQRFASKSA